MGYARYDISYGKFNCALVLVPKTGRTYVKENEMLSPCANLEGQVFWEAG